MSFATFTSFSHHAPCSNLPIPSAITAAAFGALTTLGQIPLTGITYDASAAYYNVLVNGTTVASNQTASTYTYTSLTNNTNYGPFTVVPYDAAGVAGTPFTVTGGTAGSLYTLGVVTSTVTFGSTNATGTTLSCSGAYSSLIITYSPTDGTPASGATISGANTTSRPYTGLSSSTPYTFSVYAVNGNGVQNGTAVTGTVTTSAPPPPLWVAGGNGITNTLVYSTNGFTWTGRGTGVFDNAGGGRGVAYGNGLWVAVGNGTNSLAYSMDGFTWTGLGTTVFSSTGQGAGVAYGSGVWVGVGYGGNLLATSTNGVTWTGRGNTLFSTNGYGVAYGNGLWVAVGTGNTLAYSTDGISWTGRGKAVFSTSGFGVAYGSGLWVATGQGGNTIATSPDGLTWTGLGTTVFSTNGTGVAYGKDPIGNPLWVAGGTGGNSLAYSTDGVTWTGLGKAIFSGTGSGVAYSSTQNRWVATGNGINSLAYSTNGVTWTGRGAGTSTFNSIGYAVAVTS